MSLPCALCPMPSRRGITLLEVLISIGVVSVGVLGAATMLPMATYFQNEATNYDRGGALAQQAVHDLEVKSYLSPRRWIFVNPSGGGLVGIEGLPLAGAASRAAFVIDPLGFAYAAQAGPAASFPSYFPAFPQSVGGAPPGGGPYIYRAGITANDYWPPAATMPVAPPIPMTYSVADRMMRSNDDVLFEYDPTALRAMKRKLGQPDDFDQRPLALNNLTANLTAASAANPALNMPSANSPDFAGEYSWIATVSRVPSDMGSGAVVADLHRFQVTVVVLANRDLTLWTGAGGITLEEPPSERQVYAMFTQYGGQSLSGLSAPAPFYGGGGLQLYVYEPAAPVAAGAPSRHWLENIKPNTYLMLTGWFYEYTAINYLTGTFTPDPNPYPQIKWYRIVNVDDGPNQDPNNATRWYRNLTVTGGDWPSMYFLPSPNLPPNLYPFWYGADPSAPGMMPTMSSTTVGAAAPVVFCTLMNNSIASYDAVITLDYSLVHE